MNKERRHRILNYVIDMISQRKVEVEETYIDDFKFFIRCIAGEKTAKGQIFYPESEMR